MKTIDMISNGVLNSTINDCIQVNGNVWGSKSYSEQTIQSRACTRSDILKLQVLQNKALKLLIGKRQDFPTAQILANTGKLTVNQ